MPHNPGSTVIRAQGIAAASPAAAACAPAAWPKPRGPSCYRCIRWACDQRRLKIVVSGGTWKHLQLSLPAVSCEAGDHGALASRWPLAEQPHTAAYARHARVCLARERPTDRSPWACNCNSTTRHRSGHCGYKMGRVQLARRRGAAACCRDTAGACTLPRSAPGVPCRPAAGQRCGRWR